MLQETFKLTVEGAGAKVCVEGYFHDEYHGMYSPLNNIKFVNQLKNDLLSYSPIEINQSEAALAAAVRDDFAWLTRQYGALTLCGVPRSKRETSYPANKMGLKRAFRRAVGENLLLSDGLDFIIRHTDTRCTHRGYCGHGGDGESPRPGLIADTCRLDPAIAGRDILLVDDIYTPGCGIDEDAICALFNAGARSVIFYAIGYTISRGRNFRRCA